MDPLTLGLLVTAVVGTAIKVGSDLADNTGAQQAMLLHNQAAQKQSAFEETMRRAEGSQSQVLASTKARAAASGFALTGSFSDYLSGMATQFQFQNSADAANNRQSVDLILQGAGIAGDPTAKNFRAASDLASGLGQVGKAYTGLGA